MSAVDLSSQNRWDEYSKAEKHVLNGSNYWAVVKSDCKRSARIAAMQHVLLTNDYSGKNLDNIGEIDPKILKG